MLKTAPEQRKKDAHTHSLSRAPSLPPPSSLSLSLSLAPSLSRQLLAQGSKMVHSRLADGIHERMLLDPGDIVTRSPPA
jgi:hypothetical protein